MAEERAGSGAWSQRLIVGVVLVLVLVVAVSALLSSSSHKASLAPKTTPPPATTAPPAGTNVGFSAPRCAAGEMAVSIGLRRPSQRQRTGVFQATSTDRVATIVLRNVGHRRCLYDRRAFMFRIVDRGGRLIGEWDSGDDPNWFFGYYRPGAYRTLTLPNVYTCLHPGPYTAVAIVGGYTALRRGLRDSEVTCS
jgi:hypothetical protein